MFSWEKLRLVMERRRVGEPLAGSDMVIIAAPGMFEGKDLSYVNVNVF